MKSVRWMLSYILVASLGLWLAFAVSVKFMAPAHSQGAPTAADLPPEFLKEIESTQAPAVGNPSTPPPAQQNGGQPSAAATPGQKQVPPAAAGAKPGTPPPAAQNPVAAQQQPTQPAQAQPPVSPDEMPMGDSMTAPQANSVPAMSLGDEYIYDPTGKRDPFKPFRVLHPTKTNAKSDAAVEPLQRWELERLQIVGILWDVKTPRAMVKDPDGAVFTVVKNTKIGRNEGYVAAIREGELVVVETKYDDGKAVKETRVLEFKK